MMLFIASEVMFFVAWFWAFFDASLFTGEAIQASRVAATGGVWPPEGHRRLRPLAPAAAQHADPADLGHHRHLGAPCAAATTTARASSAGLCADHRAGRAVHLRPGLRVRARRLRLQPRPWRQHLWLDLLHGDRLPRLPRAHRHDLPDRLPVPRLQGPLHARAAFRLRGGGLVLALRRRGLAVPVRLHLRLGLGTAPSFRSTERA